MAFVAWGLGVSGSYIYDDLQLQSTSRRRARKRERNASAEFAKLLLLISTASDFALSLYHLLFHGKMSTPLHKHQHGADTPGSLDSKGELETDSWHAGGSVFEDEVLAKFYEPPEEYEGKHRFDVNARWTPTEEKALLRKVDLRVCLFVCICFAALQLDRGNVRCDPAAG